MNGQQGTIEESGEGVKTMTYSRQVYFHLVTKEEMENLMNTSFEFQVCTGLAGIAVGALLTTYTTGINNLFEHAFFLTSLILSAIFIGASLYFYTKMTEEKEKYFSKFYSENERQEEEKKILT